MLLELLWSILLRHLSVWHFNFPTLNSDMFPIPCCCFGLINLFVHLSLVHSRKRKKHKISFVANDDLLPSDIIPSLIAGHSYMECPPTLCLTITTCMYRKVKKHRFYFTSDTITKDPKFWHVLLLLIRCTYMGIDLDLIRSRSVTHCENTFTYEAW